MYALIHNNEITTTGRLPRVWHDGTRWWDMRDGTPTAGWHKVIDTPRPADTNEHTHDHSVQLIDGIPTEVWTPRPWSQDELDAFAAAAEADAQAARDRAILDATAALAANREDGQPWTQPLGAHDAYRLDVTVTHGGKTWTSTVDFNVHEPGVSGWREVVEDGYPAWVQPAGAHDAYELGDKVTHKGRVWECTQVNGGVNSYEPGVWGWTDIGPA